MQSTAWVSDDTSTGWKLPRKGGGKVVCESVHSSSIVRMELADAPSLPVGFELLSDLVEELSADPLIAEDRMAFAVECREHGVVTLATLRMERGLSQTDLGNLIGTSQAAISRLEMGTQEPLLGTLRKLASALAVDVNTLNAAFIS